MKILLVNPPMASYYHRLGLKYPPLGVGYIAGALQKEGYTVRVIDLNVDSIKINNIPYQDFDIVGISTDTTRYPIALSIARYAKAKGCKVVIGGPHTTFLDRETLETGFIDYVVRGEGELIILDLVRALEGKKDIREVKGISYIKDGEFVKSQFRINKRPRFSSFPCKKSSPYGQIHCKTRRDLCYITCNL